MAFLPTDQQNNNAPQGQTTNIPPISSGSSGAGTGGAAKTSSGGTPTQFGSSASKLGDYLSANAPQIQQQGQNVAGQLNNQFQQVGTDITNAGNDFNQQIAGGYAAPNQDLVNQVAANPTQFAANPSNVSGFQAQYNDQYTGPQNFQGSNTYSNINNEVNQAVQNAGLLNTQAGLQGYLAGTQGGNQTQASNTLDALLLQGNPQSQAAIQQAVSQYGQLTPQVQALTDQENKAIQNAQNAAQGAQQYAQNTFNPVATNFNTGLTNAAQQAEAARTVYNKTGEQGYQTAYNALTPYLNTFNQNSGGGGIASPVTSFSQITNPITAANLSTPQQYAEAAALQQLLGNGYQSPLDQTLASQAGTAPTVGQIPSYDLGNLSQQIANAATSEQTAQYGVKPAIYNEGANSPYETLLGQLMQYDPNNIKQAVYGNTPIAGEYTLQQ